LKDGDIRSFEITPEQAGLTRSNAADLKGGDAIENAEALKAVLDGTPSSFTDAALLTAAAALVVAGKSAGLKEGVAVARDAINSGRAAKTLAILIEVSNS
jgi:anthranilate phosphoribosyltransferase